MGDQLGMIRPQWSPPWWFDALKSVPVIHFDHSEMLENGHFCHVKSCKSQKRHVNHALFQSEVQYNHVLINPCFIFRVFGWLFPQAFCVDLDIIWGWSLKTPQDKFDLCRGAGIINPSWRLLIFVKKLLDSASETRRLVKEMHLLIF